MTSYTNSSVKIVESCVGDDCSLEWVLNSDDNNNPDCLVPGTSYKIRLYKIPPDLDVSVFSTNGSLNFVENINQVVEEESVIFNGEQTQEFEFSFNSGFSYTLIGNALTEDGVIIPNITFSITPGYKEIRASVPCFACLEVNYTSLYSHYNFIGFSKKTALIVARTTCDSDEIIHETATMDLKTSCDDEECLPISVTIDTTTDRGANYDNENKKLIRVYGATRNQISVKATKGSVEYLGTTEEKIDETLTGCDGEFSASKFVSELVDQEIISGNIKPFVVERGSLRMVISPGDGEKHGILPGYGAVRVEYISKFLEFLITASDLGKGVFYVINTENDEEDECDIVCIDYDLGGEGDGVNRYDITVIYRDFVTGAPIPQAKIWVDNKSVGETNDAGEIFIENVTSEIKHLIRAEKPGYLNTDSDSLANDSFIIRED